MGEQLASGARAKHALAPRTVLVRVCATARQHDAPRCRAPGLKQVDALTFRYANEKTWFTEQVCSGAKQLKCQRC